LADRLTGQTGSADTNSLLTALQAILTRLGREQAAAVAAPRARAIAARMAGGDDPGTVQRLSTVWSPLARWLDPDEAAAFSPGSSTTWVAARR
jgi:hypothetical protein